MKQGRFNIVILFVCGFLTGCDKGKGHLRGWWELDVEKTLAQYHEVPTGYERLTLLEFRNSFHEQLGGRVYKFTNKRPRLPEWGERNFDGTIQMQGKEGLLF